MRIVATLLLAGIVSSSVPGFAGEELSVDVQPDSVVNGGVLWVTVHGVEAGEPIVLTWEGREVPVWRDGESDAATALLPVKYDTEPGRYPLHVKNGTAEVDHRVQVVDAKYPVERLTLPKDKVSGFSKETLARIGSEKKTLDAIWVTTSKQRYWKGGWIWPVPGKITSSFGKRRIINGEPHSPHSGTDHRAAKGTPIKAAQRGKVVLTADQFYTGNLVILDHGQGLYSMYFHLSETDVSEGDMVEQGDVLGKVGSTGRASGPHLHWGVRLLNQRVDAERLLDLLPKKSKG